MGLKNQTPETPNVLGIYVFSKVLKDMINIGVENIRRDTIYKSTLLYNTINTIILLLYLIIVQYYTWYNLIKII